jgi:hypothetical protein
VEVDDPLRLAEALGVGRVGLDLRLRDVEAGLAEDGREQARAGWQISSLRALKA